MNNVENLLDIGKLKTLPEEEYEKIAQKIRELIINRVNLVGGHLAPDLGIVETTIALHKVFNSPKDKIIFDVSHQCYPHKILTGRKAAFEDPIKNKEITGYSNPNECEHDHFVIGHTSTSVSIATGVAKARDIKSEEYNVIALIGDGSLSGGEAFEGFNNAAELNSNIIIIVNDNEMSIAENFGGIYKNLKELRETNGKSQNNIFKAIGFEYYYEENGNDTKKLIKLFEKVKDTKKPTVVHIHTLKGKGFEPAEKDKEKYHWIMPGFLEENKAITKEKEENYYDITTNYIINKKDEKIMVVTPATPGAVGLTPEIREKLGKQYTDVGIAEEHAVAYISGMAKNGVKPVLFVLSSFIQRAYDQLSQDLALNNSPATILIFWGEISSADVTHLHIFDIPLISNIPNIVYLAPTCKEEYLKMLEWSIEQTKYPVAIRVPTKKLVSANKKDETDYNILNKYEVTEKGNTVAIIGLGNFFELAKDVKKEIQNNLGINSTLINPKFISGIDKDLLNKLKENHKIVITLEDGILDGGFGQKIAQYYGKDDVKVLCYGADKEFTDRVPLDELYKKYRLTKEQICEDVKILL